MIRAMANVLLYAATLCALYVGMGWVFQVIAQGAAP
jgi:hypothetical protein